MKYNIYNCDYCVCKQPEPDEIKRGVVICLECDRQIELPDEQPEDDMSECEDVVRDMTSEYEYRRENDITNDRPL